jgi:hypothetical protein
LELVVKVIRTLGAFGLGVKKDIWEGGKEVAQEVSCKVIKALITCRLDVGKGNVGKGGAT